MNKTPDVRVDCCHQISVAPDPVSETKFEPPGRTKLCSRAQPISHPWASLCNNSQQALPIYNDPTVPCTRTQLKHNVSCASLNINAPLFHDSFTVSTHLRVQCAEPQESESRTGRHEYDEHELKQSCLPLWKGPPRHAASHIAVTQTLHPACLRRVHLRKWILCNPLRQLHYALPCAGSAVRVRDQEPTV